MREATVANYRADTGHKPIDAIRYRLEPTIQPYAHAQSQILLFRVANHGKAGEITTVNATAAQPDLLFLSRGTGAAANGKVAGTPFKVAGSRALRATFIPHGVDTSVTFAASTHSCNLMFPHGYLAGFLGEFKHHDFGAMLFREDDCLIRLSRMLDAEVAAPGFASSLLIDGLSRTVAALLSRVDLHAVDHAADRIYLPPWKLRRIIDYIDMHLGDNIRLDDLAQIAALSPFHFSRVFKRATGMSPYHFVRDRRLERSRQMLNADDVSIAELALACGFSNQSHFTAAFSKAMGVSPARFRQFGRA